MNPRQRRGVLLMITSAIGAVCVFVLVIGYVQNVQADADAAVGEMTTVLQVQSDVEAFQPIAAASVRETEIPKKWATGAFITQLADLQNKVAAGRIPRGAYLQQGMLQDRPALSPGQREIAVMIDSETGVAGKVVNGSIVDVYSTFESISGSREGPCAVRILDRVQVINVGPERQVTDTRGNQPPEAGGGGGSGGVTSGALPVTFALSADETLRLTYAESFSRKLRLALVGGQEDTKPPANRLCNTPAAGR
ncbi:Flp pilus assembly protein CpaB [Actinomadura sp. 7K507]|uniref:Flp pilus assembly protein CpaB n=1 Tax=Actinomadura sp. 7K507 TaxID=2530365 RepID=UPI0010445BBC|nr:Flp pilus assembly protein CpaB [Actinomadura sp. 7K507]TDC80842.1 Flp pilus assembly protein CpaB [Actinomadura sp. 7K507]